ncbi:VOC family protein [Cellulosimicrobium terreum]|nr:VOC family protein [Cellulosimicrobium terreum]
MATHAHGIHHSVDYLELPVTDLAAAQEFYAAVFGWEFVDYGPGYAGIRTAAESGQDEAGGLRVAEAGEISRGGPFVLLFSTDLDLTLAAVLAAGGEVATPPYEFPGGRRFHFLDPSGNELGVWATA